MKVLLATTLALLAPLASAKTVLTCGDTKYSDLARIEIVEAEGRLSLVETDAQGRAWRSELAADAWLERTIPLSSWRNYTRTLMRDELGHWSIDVSDECSTGWTDVDCREAE